MWIVPYGEALQPPFSVNTSAFIPKAKPEIVSGAFVEEVLIGAVLGLNLARIMQLVNRICDCSHLCQIGLKRMILSNIQNSE